MGAVGGQAVTTIALEDVEPIPLPGGSWSRMVLNDKSLSGNTASLGYSVFTPGCVTAMVSHETEEVAYVLSGSGELRLDGESVPFAAGQGLFGSPARGRCVGRLGHPRPDPGTPTPRVPRIHAG